MLEILLIGHISLYLQALIFVSSGNENNVAEKQRTIYITKVTKWVEDLKLNNICQ